MLQGRPVADAKSADHLALGAALRDIRSQRGWTLEQLADRVKPDGMNPRYVSACERGEVNLSLANLLRLTRALGVSLSEVVADYEQELPSARRRVRRRKS